jgi:hypothetical protein
VDRTIIYPVSPEERNALRARLGIDEDEVVFLNIGGALWNKGADVLLRAFAAMRRKHVKARLLFKDQSKLYGVNLVQVIRDTATSCPELLEPDTISAISIISDNLSNESLNELYNMADCYVSPYRAEGFNLPVLEAIAAGLQVIVTAGGATDDFCVDGVAVRIPGVFKSIERAVHGADGYYVEPSLDALIEAMANFASGKRRDSSEFAAARQGVLDMFSWRNAALKLASLAIGHQVDGATHDRSAPRALEAVTQQDILDLLTMIHPRACSDGRKVRIGNDLDGGYVVPARSLKCDLVVSIGVGPDVSFDLALAERGARVFQFDHTVAAAPAPHSNFSFYPMGWGPRSEGRLLNLHDINQIAQVTNDRKALLKFDIEGGEYDAIAAINVEDLAAYEVVVCELHDFHLLADPNFYLRVLDILSKLAHSHVPVHLHANNHGGMCLVLGVPLPCVLELSFLRRDLTDILTMATEPIPGPLDKPNNPKIPDLVLTPFR